MSESRPTVRIRLRYDTETGEFDLIVDDSAPDMPEAYHDQVAARIAGFLSHNPDIVDAGLRHVVWGERQMPATDFVRDRRIDDRDELANS